MQQHLIDQLRGIHYPAAPVNDTWQLIALLALLFIALVSVVVGLRRRLQRSQPDWQQRALRTLDRLQSSADEHNLARAALVLRESLPHLGISDWDKQETGLPYLRRLDALFQVDFFSQGAGVVFGDLLYQRPPSSNDAQQAIAGLRHVLQHYKT